MPADKIVKEHEQNMQKCIDHLKNELRGVRTGRASTSLVDSLRVEYYGTPTPLNQMATLAAPDATSIIIKPFDASAAKDIIKAIQTSELGLNPVADGKAIRLTIPPLSEERRKQIVGQIKQSAEMTKVSVRNVRRDGNKALDDAEKAKEISEDLRDKGKKNIDDLTKKYIAIVDDLLKAKSNEIMTD